MGEGEQERASVPSRKRDRRPRRTAVYINGNDGERKAEPQVGGGGECARRGNQAGDSQYRQIPSAGGGREEATRTTYGGRGKTSKKKENTVDDSAENVGSQFYRKGPIKVKKKR